MKSTQEEILLADGKIAKLTIAGHGPRIFYIVGPGSFYLSSLPETLENEITIVACDQAWARKKDEAIDEEKIKKTTREDLLAQDHAVIMALKAKYACEKIGLMGLSAPAALAFRYAVSYPEDVAGIVGVGAGLCKLSPDFHESDDLLKAHDPEIFQRYKTGLDSYLALAKGCIGEDPPQRNNRNFAAFFTEGNQKSWRLTPNSDYLEQVKFLLPKLISDEKYSEQCFQHWQGNDHSEVVNQVTRQHFFTNLLPGFFQEGSTLLTDVNTLATQATVPILLIQGKADFITPLLDNEELSQLKTAKNIDLKIYDAAAHMTYLEQPEQFQQDIAEFAQAKLSTHHSKDAHYSAIARTF